MKTKKTLTICIPAFNEAENLKKLLPSLLAQKRSTYILSKIIVASDASTDTIYNVVKKIGSKKINVIHGKERKGVAYRQNQLLEKSTSDIVVLLNADIAVIDFRYIEKLVAPIIKNKADMTSSALMETSPRTFFEKALYTSMQAKKYAFNKFKDGNNVYTCRGPARAFSKNLYKIIRFPSGIGEDAYSYLFTIKRGMRFIAVKNATVYYSLPTTFKDHKRQSLRYLSSKSNFTSKFGEKFVKDEYNLPLKYILEAALFYSMSNPIYMLCYFMIFMQINLRSLFKNTQSETWEVATSSKLLNV